MLRSLVATLGRTSVLPLALHTGQTGASAWRGGPCSPGGVVRAGSPHSQQDVGGFWEEKGWVSSPGVWSPNSCVVMAGA